MDGGLECTNRRFRRRSILDNDMVVSAGVAYVDDSDDALSGGCLVEYLSELSTGTCRENL